MTAGRMFVCCIAHRLFSNVVTSHELCSDYLFVQPSVGQQARKKQCESLLGFWQRSVRAMWLSGVCVCDCSATYSGAWSLSAHAVWEFAE